MKHKLVPDDSNPPYQKHASNCPGCAYERGKREANRPISAQDLPCPGGNAGNCPYLGRFSQWDNEASSRYEWAHELAKVTGLGIQATPKETADYIAEISNILVALREASKPLPKEICPYGHPKNCLQHYHYIADPETGFHADRPCRCVIRKGIDEECGWCTDMKKGK
jgi:hypothetical protein